MALPAPVKPNHSDNCPQRKQLLEVKGHEASSGPPSMRVCYWQEWSGTQNHPSTHTHTHSPRCQPGRFLNLHVWMLPDSEASALSWLLWDQVYQELKWRLTSASFLLLCTPAGHKIVITIILFHWHVLCPADAFIADFRDKAGALPLWQPQFLSNKPILYLPPPFLFPLYQN